MIDRPILFSGPMVRAILDGRKTQTRRVLKPQVVCHLGTVPSFSWGKFSGLYPDDWFGYGNEIDDALPYHAGERLWVREAIAYMPRTAYALPKVVNPNDPDMAAYYRADFDRSGKPGWKPGIHMSRWASRLTLTVTDVRVQRLHEISEEDALAEGIGPAESYAPSGADRALGLSDFVYPVPGMPNECGATARAAFCMLWNSINASRGFDWSANPWIVALTFTVAQRNIDEVQS